MITFSKNKKRISDQRIFYIRTTERLEDNGWVHIPFFKGKLLDKNIWIDEMCEIPKLDLRTDISTDVKNKMKWYNNEKILNFKFSHGITYALVSGFKVNTHIDCVSREETIKNNVRTYVYLDKDELKELKEMFGDVSIYKRDPIQFGLLLTTAIGVLGTIILMIIQTIQTYNGQKQQDKQQEELIESIEKLEIQPKIIIEGQQTDEKENDTLHME